MNLFVILMSRDLLLMNQT